MSTPITVAPPESKVSPNGTAQNQTGQLSGTIGKLLQADTPFLVWLIFFSVGGGILALYYARIGYLPEMEWKAALVYLFIGSMVGGVIGLLLTISLFLPGVIWADFIVFDPILDGKLTYELEHTDHSGTKSKRKELCTKTVILCLGLPYLDVLLVSHLALRLGEWYWVIAVVALIVIFFVIRKILRTLTESSVVAEQLKTRQVFKYSCWFILSALLNQISMYLIYRLSDGTPRWSDFLILTGICTAGVWITTHIVAASHRSYPPQALIASLVAAGLLLFTADNFSSLSMQLMSHYGIGYSQKFNFLVKDNGLKIINDQNLKCEESGQYLCDVEILSKMGDQYFLRVGGKTHITLPKSDVVFIMRVDSPLERRERAENKVDVGEIR
jgi:hypothetical protein